MSFAVRLYKNNSPKNVLNKNITDLLTISNVNIKDDNNINNITLIFNGNITNIADYNYLHLQVFNRYYFITDKKILRNNIYEIECEIDLLMTYKDEIKACTGIVKRQQNEYNLDLNDGSLKVYQNPHIITKPFPSGFTGSSYVLAVAGA